MVETSKELLSIALDATLWDEPTTGIGIYTRNLSKSLENEGVRVTKVGARKSGEFPRRTGSATAYFLGALPRLLPTLDVSLFHGVRNFTLPLLPVPGKGMVLTVHDIVPELLPDTVSFAFRWQSRLWLTRSLRVARQIICDSHRTREDVAARFGISADKLHVVHLGVDHLDELPRLDSIGLTYLQALQLPPRYMLYAGSLDARKNIACVLDAFASLQSRPPVLPLVIIGQAWFGSSPVEKRISSMRQEGLPIRYLGYQPPAIFYELMRRATLFLFPSRYEGFGLPPLEAMRLGVPVIVSTGGALPEVCGEAAAKIDPDRPEDLAKAITALMSSEGERRTRAAAGLKWAANFTWKRTAQQTIEVYRAALDEKADSAS